MSGVPPPPPPSTPHLDSPLHSPNASPILAPLADAAAVAEEEEAALSIASLFSNCDWKHAKIPHASDDALAPVGSQQNPIDLELVDEKVPLLGALSQQLVAGAVDELKLTVPVVPLPGAPAAAVMLSAPIPRRAESRIRPVLSEGEEEEEPADGKQKTGEDGKQAVKKAKRHRMWSFTEFLSDYHSKLPECAEACEFLLNQLKAHCEEEAIGIRFQPEICPDTGRWHIQGCIRFGHPQPFAYVKALLDKAHWEPAFNPQKLWQYAGKLLTRVPGAQVYEHGVGPKQGERNDLHSFIEEAKGLAAGKATVEGLKDDHYKVEARYTRYFDRTVQRYLPERKDKTQVTVIYGEPGTGKSHFMREKAKQLMEELKTTVEPFYPVEGNGNGLLWWDRYNGQPIVIIDDLDDTHLSLANWKRLCDKGPAEFQAKGVTVKWGARYLLVTANKAPASWWHRSVPEDRMAALSRIDELQYWRAGPGKSVRDVPREEVAANAIKECRNVQQYLNEAFPA